MGEGGAENGLELLYGATNTMLGMSVSPRSTPTAVLRDAVLAGLYAVGNTPDRLL